MKKEKHSPLPWKVNYDNNERAQEYLAGPAELWFSWNAPEQEERAKANAEFIVRACNSHYELVEALKKMNKAVLNNNIGLNEAYQLSLNAIAKAKGAI